MSQLGLSIKYAIIKIGKNNIVPVPWISPWFPQGSGRAGYRLGLGSLSLDA